MNTDELIEALNELLDGERQRQALFERAITEKIAALESPNGHELVTRIKADIDSVVTALNATADQVQRQTLMVAHLTRYVIERLDG